MKKLNITLLLLVFCTAGVMAQQVKPKKDYVPKQGDIALGFDILPLFHNFSNNSKVYNQNEVPYFMNYLGGVPSLPLDKGMVRPTVSIMGKYMIRNNVALRANVGVLIHTYTTRAYVDDELALQLNPLSEDKVTDYYREKRAGFNIALGAEYRLGEGRLQGIFGGSALFASQTEKLKATWGNKMTDVNQMPGNAAIMDNLISSNGKERLLEYKSDNKYYAGLAGHAGVEYFLGRKVAIGAEVSLTAYKMFGVQSWSKTETYDTNLQSVIEKTHLNAPGDSSFTLGTDNLGGSLYFIFYF